MLRITPTSQFSQRVSARHGALDFAEPSKPANAEKVWTAFKERLGHAKQNYWIKRVEKDEDVQRAVAMAKSGKFPEPFDVRTVAVAERLVPRGYDDDPALTLVELVSETYGLADMIAMKLVSVSIDAHGTSLDFEPIDPAHHQAPTFDHSWTRVRALVARADEASYAKARDVAAAWRAKHPVVHRIAPDYFFPEETKWANDDLDAIMPVLGTAKAAFAQSAQPILASTNDAARVEAFLDKVEDYWLWSFAERFACDLAVGLVPEDAVRVLCILLEKCKRAGKQQLLALGVAMCAVEGEAMASVLAKLLLHSPIGPLAVDYFRRFPALARSALADVASGTSKAADAARSILAASAPREDLPPADANEIPIPLRDAPWRKKKKVKALTFESPPMPAPYVVWADGERESARSFQNSYAWMAQHSTDMTAEILAKWEATAPNEKWIDMWSTYEGRQHRAYRVPDGALLREWNKNTTSHVCAPLRILAIHGEAAFPGLFARDAFKQWSDDILSAQLHVVGPESVRVAAEAMTRRKAWRRRMQEWIGKHASVVAQTLLPIALGKDGKEKHLAQSAIRVAARADHDAVIAAAHALGADAEIQTRDLIDGDPLAVLEVKGKVPPFIRVEELPLLTTRSRKSLPIESTHALLEILRSTTADAPYAGLETIREALDPKSLGDFLWAIVQAWILAGAKATFDWIPMTLALLGDDAAARRFAPQAREWARKDAKKANLAVDVLSAIGTSTALLHLSYIADKSRFEAAKTYAKEALERTAAEQGLTIDELADRTVPDLDLDATGKATLDFGPRKFSVTFDEGLRPIISNEDGATLPAFPRGTKTDDAAMVKAASARYKGIKADAESVAQSLLRRFEMAMIQGRTWDVESFRTYLMAHPLAQHIVKRLVWRSLTEKPAEFRIAEDHSLADQNDAEYTLPADAKIMLPHALDLGKETTLAWSHVLGDYGVVQPFEQLARATFRTEDVDMSRFKDRKSKAGPLIGMLDSRGWHKQADETSLSYASKTVRLAKGGTADVSFAFSPGIELTDIAHAEEQVFEAPRNYATAWTDIHAIDFSELVRDLEAMAH